jgi:hypothetical protein
VAYDARTEDVMTDAPELPTTFVGAENYVSYGDNAVFSIANLEPTFLFIAGHVKINLKDGSMEFEPGYEPSAAAKIFWQSISQEHYRMLNWKAELKNKIDTRLNNHLVDMKPYHDDSICGFEQAWDIVRKAFEE